jgi:hypothetical protein
MYKLGVLDFGTLYKNHFTGNSNELLHHVRAVVWRDDESVLQPFLIAFVTRRNKRFLL